MGPVWRRVCVAQTIGTAGPCASAPLRKPLRKGGCRRLRGMWLFFRSALLWCLVGVLPLQAIAASSRVLCGALHQPLEQSSQASAALPPCDSSEQALGAIERHASLDGIGHAVHLDAAQPGVTGAAGGTTPAESPTSSTSSGCSVCALCCHLLALPLGVPLWREPATVNEAFAPVLTVTPVFLTGGLDRPPRAFTL